MLFNVDGFHNYDISEYSKYWLWKPIDLIKYMVVSWRMSGSEFSKEVIGENFQQCQYYKNWGKSHTQLPNEILGKLKYNGVKIFFIICDPRDAVTHIINHDGDIHYHPDDFSEYANKYINELVFLDENIQIIIDLLKYFQTNFGNNLIVLRYEDAINNRKKFLKQVGSFLNTEPFYVDDDEKYHSPICKKISVYPQKFNNEYILNVYKSKKYEEKLNFLKKWGYV